MLMDINTLTAIQNERYNGFVREAEKARLLQAQNSAGNRTHPSATRSKPADVTPTLHQLLLTAMQARIRAVLPH